MSNSSARPTTLDAWLTKLESVRLSVPVEVRDDVRRALLNGQRTVPEIAEAAIKSPALALVLLREANRSPLGKENPAVTLEIALSRLGLGPAEYVLSALPPETREQYSPALEQILLISQHALSQATGLFGNSLARLRQEVRLCALLFLAPVWPLAQLYPELWTEWEQRVLGNHEPAVQVERELLGVPLLELCLALAERWSLPAWIVEGYRLLVQDRRRLVKALHIAHDNSHPLQQQQRLDADLPLRRWLTQPSNTILLANGLALAAHQSWSDPHVLRWQRLTGLYMQAPLEEVQQLTHQAAVQSAKQQAKPGFWHPAEALLWPWDERRLRPKKALPKSSHTPPVDIDTWKKYCQTLLKDPSPFTNLLQLTACACDALIACGLLRFMVLIPDRSGAHLLAQQVYGLPEASNGLQLSLSTSALLRKFMAEPAQLCLTQDNAAQFIQHLPGNLRALFATQNLILRSVGNKSRVGLLVIADKQGAPLSERDLQAFSKTMTCIERGLLLHDPYIS
ncbi:HDOD domain-containing protein [Pseudomonas duriflava]|uniref:HDOD domain-containing protein n=1 Tax=Pseudomonas duriflava TaxID=459528 RepID=A0A562Q888_9PSED|nr:HDOD domain-containing protein [Pseudomonas duriflava]TWI52400.1 HDOD domain-containing protein [Pseudomonas duriflava]